MSKKLTIKIPVARPRDPGVAAIVNRRGAGAHKGVKNESRASQKVRIKNQIKTEFGG